MAKREKKNNISNIIKSLVVIVVVAIAAIFFPELFAEEEETPSQSDLIPVELVKTIDGDTIRIKYEGKEQNVRYLLIDTPETNHPQLGKQPFGQKAKERNTELMNSGKLEIEFDIGERVDKYGRLLAYIYIDGVSVQEKLLEEGLARVGYVYPPNTRHLDAFEKAQEKAKTAGIGIWTLEDYVTERGFDSKTYPEGK
ncbi:thermonuclease family protein [Sporosarcina sp. NPDC096371]|uniref:thermonuclease family protein n=1 Tax=Sporosarcina sp. NPDC096371 TaxID=3364530 RepID=UPI003824D9FC